jgi:hypothetical protein
MKRKMPAKGYDNPAKAMFCAARRRGRAFAFALYGMLPGDDLRMGGEVL